MKLLSTILNKRKPALWSRFMSVIHQPLPDKNPPKDSNRAFEMGYRMGLREGYTEGMVDGVNLGMEVGSPDIVVDDPDVN